MRYDTTGMVRASLAFVLLGMACAHHAPQIRVAIVPVDALALPQVEGELLRAGVEQRLAQSTAHHVVSREELGPLDPVDQACRESNECLASAGRQLPADLVLSMIVTGLGSTRLVRSRLIGTRDGLVLQDLEETLTGGPAALAPFAQSLARRLFPEPEPFFGRWWVWAGAAVVVAGVATAVVVATFATTRAGVLHLGDL